MADAKPEVHPDFSKKSSTGMEPKVAVLIAHVGFSDRSRMAFRSDNLPA